MATDTRCRRCGHVAPLTDAQRCAACGAWHEPVTLLPSPASFDCDELRAAIARPRATTAIDDEVPRA